MSNVEWTGGSGTYTARKGTTTYHVRKAEPGDSLGKWIVYLETDSGDERVSGGQTLADCRSFVNSRLGGGGFI